MNKQVTRVKRFCAKTIVLAVLGMFLIVVVSLWVHWGTHWTVPIADTGGQGYRLAGYWSGTNIPSGSFERPIGIAVASDEDVYVTDSRQRVVHLSRKGGFVGEWGQEGTNTGEFSNPMGVAVAPDGSVYVSDYDQDRVQKFTPGGKFVLSFGESGSRPGEFDAPAGIAVDAAGFVDVADFYNHRVQKFSADGKFEGIIGHAGRLGEGALHYPTGVSVSPKGELVVADAYNYQLQWFTPEGRPLHRLGYHLLWLWPRPVSSDAGFNVPSGVAVGDGGLLHIADSGNHRVMMLSADGKLLSVWRMPDAGSGVYSPEDIAVSPDGTTVYATDLAGNRVVVLEVAGRAGRRRGNIEQEKTKGKK